MTGGWFGNNKIFVDDQYWTISKDHIKIKDSGQIIFDTSAQWVFKPFASGGADTTWTLSFADKVAPFRYTYFID